MALGKTHDLINLVALPGFLYFLPKELYIPFGAGYMVGTFLLSPDVDLPNSKPTKRWSFLRCLWYPYQSLSQHRGISHIPVIGSLLRLLYLISVVIFLYFFLLGVVSVLDKGLALALTNFNPFPYLNELFRSEKSMYFVLGILCADVVHIILDGLSSVLKRLT
ncbi:putative metal-binding protein [Hydrogenivirga caldilitoris]|uniref:Putative metal-binding protein n=1 Tax=Hydrogenivirga caldilitoris TaxID=246264 RepID=A0A497XSX9_9AQUI|nr:DUF2227 family putative metal-binding protein [Hydrogenivirga caldilitoris]RLJ71371.1 putative metal-binding protein [Hydrogenivirga caldilitoris]